MKKVIPIGIENYEKLIESYLYVDKTLLIKDMIDKKENVLLLPRPRRFGKTLNISMIEHFFDITKDSKELFKNTKIMKEEKYLKYLNKYPVISLSLKDLKVETYEKFINALKQKIQMLVGHKLEKMINIKENVVGYDILVKLANGLGKEEDLMTSLRILTEVMYKYYNVKVVVLIDEYDNSIIHAQSIGGEYYKKVVSFYSNFFSSALKTNDSLELGIMTGILRISKDNIFSGLNNLKVRTLLDEDYSTYFGFSEEEVECLLENQGISNKIEEVKEWYNGYNFGGNVVYNPWSVLSYLDNNQKLEPYWINTASNTLIEQMVAKKGLSKLYEDVVNLINGKSITKVIDKNIVYRDLEDENNFWSLMLMSGYLKYIGESVFGNGQYDLLIPNEEVREIYKKSIISNFESMYNTDNNKINELCVNFIKCKDKEIESILNLFLNNISVRDKGYENSYHMFILGLLSTVDIFKVMSNIESGEGYADIVLLPKDNDKFRTVHKDIGIIIELKVADDIHRSFTRGFEQIEDKRYEDVFLDYEYVKGVLKYVIVFNGKKCYVKSKN